MDWSEIYSLSTLLIPTRYRYPYMHVVIPLRVCQSKPFLLKTLITQIFPAGTCIFPSYNPVIFHQRGPPDLLHQKLMQIRNTKTIIFNPMQRFKILSVGSIHCANIPLRRTFTTCLWKIPPICHV